MPSIFAPNWLSRQPIEMALRQFLTHLPPRAKVVDVGCGKKPYASLLTNFEHIGVDSSSENRADIICASNQIPLASQSVDAIICTQTLQHVEDVIGTLAECQRILKPACGMFLTVPFGIKIVDAERYHDYWRFTKYGLVKLLGTWQIDRISETTGYVGTLAQLCNYFVASISQAVIMRPLFALNNLLGAGSDATVAGLAKMFSWHRFYSKIYLSLTSNYIIIAHKK